MLYLAARLLDAAAPDDAGKLLHVRVPMRDGVHLDTNIYHSAGIGRFPTILIRTPYGKGDDLPAGYLSFIKHGYAVVMQDVRGRYLSEGTFDALEQEGPDGYDTLDWIAHQPWSDGKVGMIGGSYLGIVQWKVALLNSPYLKAIFPVVSGDDDYLDRFYSPGGAMKLGHRLLWLSENLRAPSFQRPDFHNYIYHLPLRTSDKVAAGQTLSLFQKALDHPAYDSFWKGMSVREKLEHIHVPVFAVGGWYDNYAESDLAAFSALTRGAKGSENHRIMIGPWPHNMSVKFNGIDFGNDASAPVRAYQIEWFDHWLKGSPELGHHHAAGAWHEVRSELAEAPVEIFVMGINRWRDEQEWPLARTRYTPFYLNGKGHANGSKSDGALDWEPPRKTKQDTYTYDPKNPVPTLGGAVCCNPKIFPWGPMDQRPVERRDDVLVYTSTPLQREIEVTGPIRVVLYVSTSAPDTDFTAKLVDVFPSGEARNLTDGILRLRYRTGLDKVALAHPGEVYPVTIDAGVTSNVFLPGHQIRVEISSSNFPRFDRNLNSGGRVADEKILRKAFETVYHGKKYPSRIVLPVIPEATVTTALRHVPNSTLAKAR
jgi:putative CocE/NonD family hydrolase